MFNLINYETNERFNNFPYVPTYCDGLVGDFYPEFDCDTFCSFSTFDILYNDDFVLGKSNCIYVSDKAFKSLLRHYIINYPD